MEKNMIQKITDNIEQVIIGKRGQILNIIKGVLANGHILIEDVPGVGKTMLVKAIAKSFDLDFKRIQFTPDLLPADITGVTVFNQKTKEFEFIKGPIFANILLVDEINRTSPKTQSALLEAMEEKQVSEGNTTHVLSEPFIVLATQNPIEHQGTYPLPEAQLDRFMLKAKIGYPGYTSEIDILKKYKESNPMNNLKKVCTVHELKLMQEAVTKVRVHDALYEYIVDIIKAMRDSEYISFGVSVRSTLALMKVGQAEAYINERDYMIPDDIKKNVVDVLSHRVILAPKAKASGIKKEDIILKVLEKIEVPRIKEGV